MDVLTKAQRSANMAAIKGKNTKPERVVRSLVHRLGYRYRLHRKDLPGKPDLVFPHHKKVILVNGCFWHMHDCQYGRVVPATNSEFWERKRCGNVERDHKHEVALRDLGWDVLVLWECWTRDPVSITQRVKEFLETSVFQKTSVPSSSANGFF